MERNWLSQITRIDEPNFLSLLTQWFKDHFWYPIITFSIQIIAIPFISQFSSFFLKYLLETALFYVTPWIAMVVYYWYKIWRFHVVITTWYGVFRNNHYVEFLLLSYTDISSLYIFVKFGPAVRNWVSRLTIPKDCILVGQHAQTHWKIARSTDKGLICISSLVSDNNFNLKYDLQTRKDRPVSPTTEITLEILTNINDNEIPTNFDTCKQLERRKGSHYLKKEFTGILIPKNN